MMTRARFCVVALLSICNVEPLAAGPDGTLALYPNSIDPQDGSVLAVDFGACGAPVALVHGGFLGRVSFSLYARLGGASACGVAGVECYLEGLEAADLPPGWSAQVVYAPGISATGNLVEPHVVGGETHRRVTATWSVSGPGDANCQEDPLVFVARVDLQSPFGAPHTMPPDHVVRVVAGNPYRAPELLCALLLQCDTPRFTEVCVTGGQLDVNPVNVGCPAAADDESWRNGGAVRTPRPCPLAVDASTWGAVKGVYR